MSAPRLSPGTRLAAWIVTGPIGHLYGGVADWIEVAAKLSWGRVDPRRRQERRRRRETSAD